MHFFFLDNLSFFIFMACTLLCRSVCTCSSICHCTLCVCALYESAGGGLHLQRETHTRGECVPALFFRLFKGMNRASPSGLCAWGESQLNWATGTRAQRPDGLGAALFTSEPVSDKQSQHRARLPGLQLLLIGSKHGERAIQCSPPPCVGGGLDEQGYDEGVGTP